MGEKTKASTRPTTVMIYQQEELTPELFQEIMPLLELHWREISHYPDIPLEPDIAHYDAAYAAGLLRIFTVRDNEDQLVGYSVFVVRYNPHYKSSKQAIQDILYLRPDLRGGMAGFKFIAWCDEQLASEGIQVVYQHVKKAHNFGPVLERMGYELIDYVYGRRLDRG